MPKWRQDRHRPGNANFTITEKNEKSSLLPRLAKRAHVYGLTFVPMKMAKKTE
jgi:hypothetical protein